ncbi:sulfolipid biosynthesis protein [Thermoplasma volcanium GSS1]|uniref:Sulfolipid biosynthesis protein n=1 Tax=Thermoplasma volcanium (strain ATCC 51530 / DSM 4299 / JCM 9571 / NBRC 15438 / GSS1) TaxID=273116 RepID=Q97BC8_THEVO|nr:UDP-sulfoquinovose synthase [Thermoplasma volcanium]BAB59670.1 sulfolipid biosynthesis protein [Thermoplasma volcanium GSS1]
MKILIMGVDGYIGFPLALRLLTRGHDVYGIDNFITRKRVQKVGSDSALPISSFAFRNSVIKKKFGKGIGFFYGDATNPKFIYRVINEVRPDAIVHLAEQRSAPYSMIGLKEANETMVKNIVSTLNLIYAVKDITPEAHILKLGTMGEYGTPNIDIPEGFFEIEYHGRKDVLPFPRNASSWYHWTKVHDSNNLMFANKVWGTKVTDVMQGVVYGTRTEEIEKTGLYTRFDIDEVYGTALNRFTAEAIINEPITPYGKGGQTRGFLSLNDSIECLTLALENPPEFGEYRVFNQFDEKYSVNQLAEMVRDLYKEKFGKEPEIVHVDNPRVEKEEHYYNPEHEKLKALGYKRTKDIKSEIYDAIDDLNKFKERLMNLRNVIMPRTYWKKSAYNL